MDLNRAKHTHAQCILNWPRVALPPDSIQFYFKTGPGKKV